MISPRGRWERLAGCAGRRARALGSRLDRRCGRCGLEPEQLLDQLAPVPQAFKLGLNPVQFGAQLNRSVML